MIALSARLLQTAPLLADGAIGTMLLTRGLEPGDCPEKVNLERPGLLADIARDYFEAGAEIIQTNTFGGSPLKLAPYGLDRKTEEINARAIHEVRNVIGDRAYLSASCGPSGRILEPYGDTSPEAVFESFRRQLQVFSSEGVDMVCIETMTDLREAVLAVQAAKSVSSAIPLCASITFDPTPRGFVTIMGTTIEQAVRGLTDAGADIIGSNCGNGILQMLEIAKEFMTRSRLPVIIQSNAGLPVLRGGVPVFPESPEFMAEQSRQLARLGVRIIGGCCGTTPRHTAELRRMMDELESER